MCYHSDCTRCIMVVLLFWQGSCLPVFWLPVTFQATSVVCVYVCTYIHRHTHTHVYIPLIVGEMCDLLHSVVKSLCLSVQYGRCLLMHVIQDAVDRRAFAPVVISCGYCVVCCTSVSFPANIWCVAAVFVPSTDIPSCPHGLSLEACVAVVCKWYHM